MKKIYFIFVLLFLFSCTNNRSTTSSEKSDEVVVMEEEQVIVPLTKLNALLLLPPDSLIKHVDLSNDSLSFFPDLSNRRIKSLDLSHNQIDTVIIAFLPQGIERLNLSFNLLRSFNTAHIEADTGWSWQEEVADIEGKMSALTELNLSNNHLIWSFMSRQAPIRRLNISHNDLTGIFLGCCICAKNNNGEWHINYLNVSYNNSRMDALGLLYYVVVDTLIRNNFSGNLDTLRNFRISR